MVKSTVEVALGTAVARRWWAEREKETALRLLRGEPVDALVWELGRVSLRHRMACGPTVFLAAPTPSSAGLSAPQLHHADPSAAISPSSLVGERSGRGRVGATGWSPSHFGLVESNDRTVGRHLESIRNPRGCLQPKW